MYKIQCGRKLTKYFTSYSEAKVYCKSVGYSTSKIKPVH